MKTYDFTVLFFFNGNKKLFVCKQNIDTVCLVGVGRSFLPGDFQIDGKGRNSSKSQPVFLRGGGGGGGSWFWNGGAFMLRSPLSLART